eukprot:gene9981-6965_t
MSLYNWESNPRAHRKKVKKTGTVVLNPVFDLETSFERFLKPQPVLRANPFAREHESDPDEEVEEDEEVEDDNRKPNKKPKRPTIPLMTAETVQALRDRCHFSSLLPSQAQCYKGIFLRRDVILHSRTGSGKTLAYALPIIERYLLFKDKMKQKGVDVEEHGPFFLVFVFSVDLAVQTQSVLVNLYPQLRIEVPGYSTTEKNRETNSNMVITDTEKKRLRRSHILIGTVHHMDVVLRGHHAAAEALQAEQQEEKEAQQLMQHTKRQRSAAEVSAKTGKKKACKEDEDEEAEVDSDSDDETETAASTLKNREEGVVNPASVQAIVIDEVDTTLGPRFSSVGRRMKNLLKYIRKANGALTPGLLSDYRSHHYVLCGATIPNWVVKAGFLGVKKYYYRLVHPGAPKLVDRLECYQLPCSVGQRIEKANELLRTSLLASAKAPKGETKANGGVALGRVVVFGTHKQIERLSVALRTGTDTATSNERLPVYTLTSRHSEADRIAAFTAFNNSKHPSATLLCTDIAARGLDLVGADTILMLSLPIGPMAVETFIHRAGRTARVDKSGRCVVLVEGATDKRKKNPPQFPAVIREEHESLTRICTAAHVVFKDFAATLGGDTESKARLQLEVLERELAAGGADHNLLHLATDVEDDATRPREIVRFSAPMSSLHLIQQKLWKYAVKKPPPQFPVRTWKWRSDNNFKRERKNEGNAHSQKEYASCAVSHRKLSEKKRIRFIRIHTNKY